VRECLNNNNFLLFAMQNYSNPFCTGIIEFQEDMLRIKYVKRLLFKFKKTGILKTRLILNHVIILQNMFGVEASVRILFFKLSPELHQSLKAFMVYLNYIPPNGIPEVNLNEIQVDEIVLDTLRKIK
jgi:hypothetical protein